jgi:hypothetical protein
MKKFFTLLFFAAALIACDTEPLDPSLNTGGTTGNVPGGGNVTDSIVGDWLYTDVITTTTTTTTVMGNAVTFVALVEFVSSDVLLTFNSDGTYTYIGDLTFESFVDGVSFGNQTSALNDAGTYLITGDVIEFSSTTPGSSSPFASDDTEIIIDTLDAVDLVFEITGSTTQNAGGGTLVIDTDGSADFERQ